jgi:hypothetical protein
MLPLLLQSFFSAAAAILLILRNIDAAAAAAILILFPRLFPRKRGHGDLSFKGSVYAVVKVRIQGSMNLRAYAGHLDEIQMRDY